MSRFKSVLALYVAIGLSLCGLAAPAAAQKMRNEKDVANIVRSLNSKIDDFRYSLKYGLKNSSIDEQDADALENNLATVDGKMRDFENNFNQRRENADDVTDLLSAAKGINDFLSGNRVNNTVEKDWSDIRTLLDRLASNYNVSWNWTNGTYNTRSYPTSSNQSNRVPTGSTKELTGTYQLDPSKSENTNEIVDSSGAQTDDQRRDLEDKLEAADQLAIEIRGSQVTLASSKTAPATFLADGRTRSENDNGRAVRVRAELRGSELTVSSVGGSTDFTMVFTPVDGGRALKVTRRITTDYLSQTVFAESYYTKTDSFARLDINKNPNSTTSSNYPTNPSDNNSSSDDNNGSYSSNDPNDNGNTNYPTTTNARTGEFIVPNGTIVSGILENDLTTKISQNNDRFRLTVQSPNEYRGAVIEGYVSNVNRSGKVTGSSKLTFNFEKITLRDGRTYEFAGYLQGITDTNGKVVKIDSEGTAKGDSQTKETVKRGGIGAGAGAIIGAILGGAKGAAIGAAIGGGAGAGSVIVQGKDDLDLKKGSTITVQATSPNR
ncbi:MAG: hypothetical protein JSS81_27745 [Acidobacteria bacterium]|nr:hypothetical protein [Acidobacteriota bacterium]